MRPVRWVSGGQCDCLDQRAAALPASPLWAAAAAVGTREMGAAHVLASRCRVLRGTHSGTDGVGECTHASGEMGFWRMVRLCGSARCGPTPPPRCGPQPPRWAPGR